MKIVIKIKDSATLSRIDKMCRVLGVMETNLPFESPERVISTENGVALPFGDVIESICKEW